MGRPTRGSRLHEFYADLDSASLKAVDGQIPSSLDSAFQLQEYISALVRADPHDVERIVKLPWKDDKDRGEDRDSQRDEPEVDAACWIYEQLRRLALDLTYPLVDMLQQSCNRRTCPEMKAGEWLYLCAAHGPSGVMEQCCAIDYVVHTIDSATALLNSPRAFPSRLSIPSSSRRHFPSLARRLGRIFAHAYFHHREGFAAAEAQNSLYARFLALCRRFDLVPLDFLVIPLPQDESEHTGDTNSSRAGNGNDEEAQSSSAPRDSSNITILSRPNENASTDSTRVNAEGTSPGSSSTSSRSPRNRLRTDTMYLSGTFHGINSGASGANAGSEIDINPRRVPSPLAATLASQEEEDEKTALAQSEPQNNDGSTPSAEDTPPDGAPSTTAPTSVPIIVSNAPAKILVRDFALESPITLEPISESTTTTASDSDSNSVPTTATATATISIPVPNIPPIIVNAPQVVISQAPDDDITSSLPKSDFTSQQNDKHVITEVSAEDEEEENPDVDDLELALENDDEEDEEHEIEEHGEGEGGDANMGMELPESDITSASAIEVRFEEAAPERKEEDEPEPGPVQESDSSSLTSASEDTSSEQNSKSNTENVDASQASVSVSKDTMDDSKDVTETEQEQNEEDAPEVVDLSSSTDGSDAQSEPGVGEEFEHVAAEPLSDSSSTSEDLHSQPTPSDAPSNQPPAESSSTSTSDDLSSHPNPPTDEEEEVEIELGTPSSAVPSLPEANENEERETEG